MNDDRPHIAIAGGTREMNDEEYAAYQEEQPIREAENLRFLRSQVQNNILRFLAESDKWAARAFEEGTTMSAARIAYRQNLRSLLSDLEKSDDPFSLVIPEAPPYS